MNGTIGGPLVADANTLTSDNADGIDLDFDGSSSTSAIAGTITVQNNIINFEDDGIGVDHRDAAGTLNVTISDNTLNGIAGDDATIADLDDGIFIFTDDDTGAAVNQVNVKITGNEFNNIASVDHIIVVENVRDGNKLCVDISGNSIGTGAGEIELDTVVTADLSVVQTSVTNLSDVNNSITVDNQAPGATFGASACIP